MPRSPSLDLGRATGPSLVEVNEDEDSWMLAHRSAQFFSARKLRDGVIVRGQLSCDLGHRLPSRSQGIQDGVFGGWRWDGRALSVEHDRYGFYPLFYYCRADEFAISPSLVTLLHEGAPLDIDADALAVFLHLGFFIGNDTPFEYIKVVPPNVRFVWNGSLDVEECRELGGWLDISRTEAVGAYAELFRQAVRKRKAHGKAVVPLSGGRDSRHILLELCELGRRPAFCLTADRYGPGSDDVEVARALTQELGLKHVVLPRLPRLAAELRKNLATSFCADEHAWLVPLGDSLNESGVTIYDGIGGDVLSASLFQKPAWLELYRAGRLGELASALIERRADAMSAVIQPEFRAPRGRETALERIVDELERYAGATSPPTMFFFWNRTRREIALAPFGLLSGVETCFCPYLDHELFDFLASLPPEVTIDRSFHTETIERTHPTFAHLPYAVPRQRRAFPALATFGGRVVWYGLRRRPRRIGPLTRLAAETAWRVVGRSSDHGSSWIDPDHLLHLLQLEDLRRDIAGARSG
jgi:asparagine synthase (glutamine-hydrolysing)